MSSVEWGTSAELATGGKQPSRSFLRAFGTRLGQLSDVRARRIAAGGLLVTFGLVLAAQWEPWFTLQQPGSQEDFSRILGSSHTVGAMTALYQLADPYFLGWSLIGVVGTTAVLGRPRFRRTAAGITAGAIAGQTLVVMTVWHDNGVGLFGSLTGVSQGVQGHRAVGIYLAVAALVVSALSMVIAVRGRLLALFHDDDEDEPVAVVPRRRLDDGAVDDFEVNRPRLGSPSVEAIGSLDGDSFDDLPTGTMPPAHAERPDHSMYMRPQGVRVQG